ncbi:MAG: hypothetical protein GY854_24670, partial [Deltaproteobacteria bacterium]|nr:hypothetical protein [Deltaproteobacteria bacterium]
MAFVAGGCDSFSTREEWQAAQQMWEQRDNRAFLAWMELDEESDEGKAARKRLEDAEIHYKAGIELIKADKFEAALHKLERGAEIAPIDPA